MGKKQNYLRKQCFKISQNLKNTIFQTEQAQVVPSTMNCFKGEEDPPKHIFMEF